MLKGKLSEPRVGRLSELLAGHQEPNEVELGELDSIKIPAGIGHKVIAWSADNAVIVTCDPVFIPGDEQRCDILESRYATSSDALTDLGVPARPNYLTETGE